MQASSAKESSNRKVLGRGLAALMSGSGAGAPPSQAAVSTGLRQLPIERVRPNKKQPRKTFEQSCLDELAASIKEHGILQPIVVRRDGEHYEIVAGERRWRAATRAGVHEIPAIIKEYTDSEVLQVALIENLQREDLDPLEEAEGYHRLINEHELTHEQVAAAVSKSRSAISNSLRLLKLPKPVLALLGEGRLTAGHARALMVLNDASATTKLANDIVDRGLSVRDAEHAARQLVASGKKKDKDKNNKAAAGKRSPEELHVEERLQQALGTKVRLHHRRGKGRIEIFFHSFEELDAILDQIST